MTDDAGSTTAHTRPLTPVPGWPTAAAAGLDVAALAAKGRAAAALAPATRSATRTSRPDSPGIGEVLCDRLLAVIEDGGRIGCEHLSTTNPAFWMPSIPRALLCGDCLATCPVPAECDGCGARQLPIGLVRCVLTVGPTTLVPFLCGQCAPR